MADWTTDDEPHLSPLVSRLLDQNDRLIGVLAQTLSEVLGAPPIDIVPPPILEDPWPIAEPQVPDPWADDSIPPERVIPGLGGWVSIPQIEEAKADPETAVQASYLPVDEDDDELPSYGYGA